VTLYLLYRGFHDSKYFARLGERLGFLPWPVDSTVAGSIWFHAVSVGEVLSLVELLRRLRPELPRVQMFVSTTTLAGRATADQKLAGLADGVFFAPVDYRSAVRRVLRRLQPALVVVLETEIWPNLYRESKRAGAALLIVNGRISDRALPRYIRWRGFFRHVLRWPDAILTQTDEDRRRFIAAGAPSDRVEVAGNLKYDFAPPAAGIAAAVADFLKITNPRKVWIAASTMPPLLAGEVDEDDAVLAAFRSLAALEKGLLLILAPRRPERFDSAAEKLQAAGVPSVRRSQLRSGEPLALPGVLLLDSIGELAALFESADVVFMGGTLASRGGHNILEPAFFGKPVITGPHLENFAAIAAEFQAAEALCAIDSAFELAPAVAGLLQDRMRAAMLGSRAREVAISKRGIGERLAQRIRGFHAQGVPDRPHALLRRVSMTPLSWVWRAGHRFNLARSGVVQRGLETPVISVGALSMGGAGKTPMVAHLASRFREMGRDVAILTRGYRRKSAGGVVVVPRGEKASRETTGDEAQIFVRSADAHLGIGANRYKAGKQMERTLHPDIFILDDGFQHLRLRRKHDIVLIDALDPWGGGVFPLGRLREPLENLRRATEIVITRVRPRQDTSGLERLLRRYNTEAPIFRSRVAPCQWIDAGRGSTSVGAAPPFRKVAAFCGIGMPRSFWETLEQLGMEIVLRRAFGDHHRYRHSQIEQLAEQAKAAGADALVTTEKDMVNLCDGTPTIVAPFPLFWLKIGIEIDNEEEFLRRIL
jgi:tetraacyldisaccharide 4'-kinase